MSAAARSRPAAVYVLLVALVFIGLSGVAGGFGLLSDPSGGAVRMPVHWLEGSPFPDYLVPGLVLFTLLGLAPLVVTFGLWGRRAWAWYGSLLVGVSLLIWLCVQILVIGYHAEPPLQLIFGALGVLIVLLALRLSVRRYCRSPAATAAASRGAPSESARTR